MNNEDKVFTVFCVNCNDQVFKFSMNLLVKNEILFLQCPKCGEETKIKYKGVDGVVIEKH